MRKGFLICVVLVVLSMGFFAFNLGDLSSLKGDENYYFVSGRQMLRTGDWVTPHYHHHIRFEKPPMQYWLAAMSFKLFGVSWASARFSSVLLAALIIALIYLLVLRLFGRKEALFSVLVLAANELFFRHARLCISDMPFLFFITASLFLFVKSYKNKSGIYFVLSFIPMGLSMLTKGPLGPILILLTIAVFSIKQPAARALFKIKNLFFGILIFLVISLPWAITMAAIHKEAFLQHIWSTEILGKLSMKARENAGILAVFWHFIKSFGYYVPVIFLTYLPWSIFLPKALGSKKGPGRQEGYKFILSWFWVVFIFFSIAGFKHTHYMLAIAPALSILIGVYLAGVCEKRAVFKKAVPAIGVLSVIFFLLLVGLIFPLSDDGAMRVFSLKLSGEIEKGDKIGMGSRQFNIKKFGAHLNNLVTDVYEESPDELAQYTFVRKESNLVSLLRAEEKIFVLITRADYENYVPSGLRGKINILETHNVWNRKKLKKIDLALVKTIAQGDFNLLKEEAYLITNKK